jgi:hypothetical protein
LTNPTLYNPPSALAPIVPVPAAQDPSEPTQTGAADGEWRTIEKRVSQFEREFGYRPFGSKIRQASMSSPDQGELWQ